MNRRQFLGSVAGATLASVAAPMVTKTVQPKRFPKFGGIVSLNQGYTYVPLCCDTVAVPASEDIAIGDIVAFDTDKYDVRQWSSVNAPGRRRLGTAESSAKAGEIVRVIVG